ncbi:hypothetical protein INR49_020604 [Caranx melampygus]|nr:hypothetical protein INR49_020604 [Caranx melampygus]
METVTKFNLRPVTSSCFSSPYLSRRRQVTLSRSSMTDLYKCPCCCGNLYRMASSPNTFPGPMVQSFFPCLVTSTIPSEETAADFILRSGGSRGNT